MVSRNSKCLSLTNAFIKIEGLRFNAIPVCVISGSGSNVNVLVRGESCVHTRDIREVNLFISVAVLHLLFAQSHAVQMYDVLCAFILISLHEFTFLYFVSSRNFEAHFMSNASHLLCTIFIWREFVRPCVFIDFSLVYILVVLKPYWKISAFDQQQKKNK